MTAILSRLMTIVSTTSVSHVNSVPCLTDNDAAMSKPAYRLENRQSYRHADPRRQQQHTAVAARVTSNSDRLPQSIMCTKFGVDS